MSAQQQEQDSSRGQPSIQYGGGHVEPGDLSQQLSDLARSLEQQEDTADMLESIVAAAIDLIPGVEEASISVVTGRSRSESQAPSGTLPVDVDRIQTETGEGPCLDAVYREQTVRVPDMASEDRWPLFSQRAHAAGAGSMLAFQLFVEGDNLGALNLYSRTAGAFDDESEHVGLLFASHAAVAFAGARKHEQLVAGIATRDLIGQAKGILMERYALTGDRAFAMLTRVSRTSNVKLRDVAAEVVRTREASAGPTT